MRVSPNKLNWLPAAAALCGWVVLAVAWVGLGGAP